QAYVLLGTTQMGAFDPESALQSFQRATEIDPDFAGAQSNVAWTLLNLQRPAEAEAYARRAIRLAPAYVDARYALGLALVMQGHVNPEAIAALRIAAEKRPEARPALAWAEERLRASNK